MRPLGRWGLHRSSLSLSPGTLTVGGWCATTSIHYKFPPIALSSITNRVTGVMLSVGMSGVGYVSLTGDVGATIEALKAVPLVLPLFKFSMSFPIVYHTLGGFRHLWSEPEPSTRARASLGPRPALTASPVPPSVSPQQFQTRVSVRWGLLAPPL